jgi:putative ATPase
MLQADRLGSLLFYGPPGVGKTSLAMVIAHQTKAKFCYLSAPAATVKDIRDISAEAQNRLAAGGAKTILFLDEIHRFNRAQQDVLLDDVESGVLILIGATTENPYFSITGPLISRSTVFRFEPLDREDILRLLREAVRDPERGLGQLRVEAEEAALSFLADMCDGDARKALTALEVGVLSQKDGAGEGRIKFNLDVAKESIQQKAVLYDETGDTHYDLASALQKSMRGSDPDATVYWLARMLAGGEDTRFIARRIAICAAEDVGNADPMATVLAAAAVQIWNSSDCRKPSCAGPGGPHIAAREVQRHAAAIWRCGGCAARADPAGAAAFEGFALSGREKSRVWGRVQVSP